MLQDAKSEISKICLGIISNPEKSIKEVSSLLKLKEAQGNVFVALAKVFKTIIPLYKIRLHSDKTKYKNADLDISDYDKKLLSHYNEYIKAIYSSNTLESFLSASELLTKLDHFNFADRLVEKVLTGTRCGGSVGRVCLRALEDHIKETNSGETIYIILDRCLDTPFSSRLVDALIESTYLHECVKIRIKKEKKYEIDKKEERKEARKLEKKARKGFFAKKYYIGKKDRKEEKRRIQKEAEVKETEGGELGSIEEKNYIKTVNALQRLYLTILRDNYVECYSGAYKGLKEYKKLIRLEFREGLYVLLQNTITSSDQLVKLEGIDCLVDFFEASGYDFKKVINHLFKFFHPFNTDLSREHYQNAITLVTKLFIFQKQPFYRALALVQRLVLLRCVRFIPAISSLIHDLEVCYNIDYSDLTLRSSKVWDHADCDDIDLVPQKPSYEYYLLKKMI